MRMQMVRTELKVRALDPELQDQLPTLWKEVIDELFKKDDGPTTA
jgi:hypothetical protein